MCTFRGQIRHLVVIAAPSTLMTLSAPIVVSEALITVATVGVVSVPLATGATQPIATSTWLTAVEILGQMAGVAAVPAHALLRGLRWR